MGLFELITVAVGLAMDAFAVSVCKGLSFEKCSYKKALIVGLYFGVFQAVMPIIGFYLGGVLAGPLGDFDHWIAFGLLAVIGAKMIKESFDRDGGEDKNAASLKIGDMLLSALATSIDALAVGVTFSFLQVKILPAALLIGAVTLLICVLGVKIGSVFGAGLKTRAELLGGVILILIGLKILFDHLGVLAI